MWGSSIAAAFGMVAALTPSDDLIEGFVCIPVAGESQYQDALRGLRDALDVFELIGHGAGPITLQFSAGNDVDGCCGSVLVRAEHPDKRLDVDQVARLEVRQVAPNSCREMQQAGVGQPVGL